MAYSFSPTVGPMVTVLIRRRMSGMSMVIPSAADFLFLMIIALNSDSYLKAFLFKRSNRALNNYVLIPSFAPSEKVILLNGLSMSLVC